MTAHATRQLMVDGVAVDAVLSMADTWRRRALGLLAQPALDEIAGLWIKPCNAIHMFGMRYAIDVAFVDGQGRVLQCREALKPWRMAACFKAREVVELRAGLLRDLGIRPGSILSLTSPGMKGMP
jgi:hypothetical protein